jgi:hypothetical protein
MEEGQPTTKCFLKIFCQIIRDEYGNKEKKQTQLEQAQKM